MSKTFKIILVATLFIGALIILGLTGFADMSGSRLGANVRNAFSSRSNVTYNIQPSKIAQGVFTFDYVFDTSVKLPRGEALFDLPIVPFDDEIACKELQRNTTGIHCDFGPVRDVWNYPVHENAFMKQDIRDDSVERKTSLNPFTPTKALAYDEDSSQVGVLNCRANTSVTGYFKAYFEDVALNTGIGFDDPNHGPARRAEACQVLQDVSELIMLDTIDVTPDILFVVDPGNLPQGVLAGASSYSGYYSFGPDDGSLHKHIISQQDPTQGAGNFDALFVVNFDNISWSIDSSLSSNTYDFYSVLSHEVIHALGFKNILSAAITSTGNESPYTTLNSFMFKDSSLAEPFFTGTPAFLQVPTGVPPLWFTSNDVVYQGVDNVLGATPDGMYPVYTPSLWQQGSSLSHFDMNRSNGQVYLMHPSTPPGTQRVLHTGELEVLCHLGYMGDCEGSSPIAQQDIFPIEGQVPFCVKPLMNDQSTSGGELYLNSIIPINIQQGDTLTYYSTEDCSGLGDNNIASNTKSFKFYPTYSSQSTNQQRVFSYNNIETTFGRVSSFVTVTLAICDSEEGEFVCNGGFEDGIIESDPMSFDAFVCNFGLSYASFWCGPQGTADYFIRNASNSMFGVPNNGFGYIQAPSSLNNSGYNNRYAGMAASSRIYTHLSNPSNQTVEDYVETLRGRLQPLETGEEYVLSFFLREKKISDPAGCNLEEEDVSVPAMKVKLSNQNNTTLIGTFNLSYPHTWNFIQVPFTATLEANAILFEPVSLQNLSGEYVFSPGDTYDVCVQYYFVDNVSIVKAAPDVLPEVVEQNIQGIVYQDNNINGVFDQVDVGLSGVQVQLFEYEIVGAASPVVHTTITQSDGVYEFSNILDNKSYYVLLEGESIFPLITEPVFSQTQNTPVEVSAYNHSRIVTFINGSAFPNLSQFNFGLTLNQGEHTGEILGKVYSDEDQSGNFDIGENPLENIDLLLFDQSSLMLIATVTSQGDGEYYFTGLADGDYYVVSDIENNYLTVTQPTLNSGLINNYDYVYEVTIASGQSVDDKDFGVYEEPEPDPTGQISGLVYYDTNHNQIAESTETRFANVAVHLYQQGSPTPLQTTQTQSGSSLGQYQFTELPDGQYYVVTDIEDNYPIITEPYVNNAGVVSGYDYSHVVTIANGQIISDVDFGVYSKQGESSISGKVYYDNNLNGNFDGNDYGIGGLYVKLFEYNSLIQVAETWISGSNVGNYEFQNVPDGNYVILLNEEDNYPTKTEPGSTIDLSGGILNDYQHIYFVTVAGGQSITGPITGADFGVSNKRPFIRFPWLNKFETKERFNP